MPVRTRSQAAAQAQATAKTYAHASMYASGLVDLKLKDRIYCLCVETPSTTLDQVVARYPIDNVDSHMCRFLQAVHRVNCYGAVYYLSHPPGAERNAHTINVIYNFLAQYTLSDEFWDECDAIAKHPQAHNVLAIVSINAKHINDAINFITKNGGSVPDIFIQFLRKATARGLVEM